jgi:hypothetical protein
MTTQAEGRRRGPQLVPRRLLPSGRVHHPAVLDVAGDEANTFSYALPPTGSRGLPDR